MCVKLSLYLGKEYCSQPDCFGLKYSVTMSSGSKTNMPVEIQELHDHGYAVAINSASTCVGQRSSKRGFVAGLCIDVVCNLLVFSPRDRSCSNARCRAKSDLPIWTKWKTVGAHRLIPATPQTSPPVLGNRGCKPATMDAMHLPVRK